MEARRQRSGEQCLPQNPQAPMCEAIQSQKAVKREKTVHEHTALAATAVSELSAQLPLTLICIQSICTQDMLTASSELQIIRCLETGQNGECAGALGPGSGIHGFAVVCLACGVHVRLASTDVHAQGT